MLTCKLYFAKSTKNTHKFEEPFVNGKSHVIGAAYIQKAVMPQPPKAVEVTIAFIEDDRKPGSQLNAVLDLGSAA